MTKLLQCLLIVVVCILLSSGTGTHNVAAATATPSAECNPDELIADLKELITYEQFAVYYNTIETTSTLAVWFVDPELDPKASSTAIAKNVELAQEHAAALAHELNQSDSCIAELFTVINPIVVDKNYNGWLSVQIEPSDIPTKSKLTDKDVQNLIGSFQPGFERDKAPKAPAKAPKDSCTWQEARENLQAHFAPTRQNVSFQFTIDGNGVNVWAQWDSPEQTTLIVASLLNVAMELPCLHPKVDQLIVTVVSEDGTAFLIGVLNQEAIADQDIGSMKILYNTMK